jgi:RNA polymerase sigma-70 factor (sigma-E family)
MGRAETEVLERTSWVGMRRRTRERQAELYGDHAPGAVRFAFLLTGDGELAKDLVQDAFVRVFGKFGDLRRSEAFPSYLRRTIVNLCNDYMRRKKLERANIRSQSLASTRTEGPDISTRDEIWRALLTIPLRQRTAVILRYYEDLSEHQTADAMSCSVSAVKSLTSRALSALRLQIRGEKDG